MGRLPAGAVRAAISAACIAVTLLAAPAHPQFNAPRLEFFGTAGGIVGVTPMSIDGTHRAGLHGGLRIDGGLQFDAIGVGLGMRVWELAPTQSFGGHGLDIFLTGERIISWDTRSTLRASVGGGFDDIDGGRGPERGGTGTSGAIYSFGAAREFIAPSGARVILSADVVMPNVNTDVNGRRRPIIELGFGYRERGPMGGFMPSPVRRRDAE